MRTTPLASLVLAALLLTIAAAPAAAQNSGRLAVLEERALKQAAAVATPSIVRIETVGGLERVGDLLTVTGPTTGLVVSDDGYIITSSFNFASRPSSILVTLADNRRFPAEQIASDQVKMLTLLKIDAENLTPAPAAPRSDLRVGQWAIALGRTYQTATPSVSVGIVSALNRIWGKAIQTDAKVSPVNYGGPLVDIDGRVIGVLVPLSPEGKTDAAGVEWYDAGIGFAIPMDEVYGVLDRLKEGKDLLGGLLGISFKGKDIYGAAPVIDRVGYNSPAQKAGLEAGDTILAVNSEPVSRVAQVRHALGSAYEGDKYAFTVRRGDESLTVEATLVGKLEPYESAFLGILPKRLPLEGGQDPAGVIVRHVFADSPAAAGGLQANDRITKFNDSPVTTAAELRDAVSRLRPQETATFTAIRGEQTITAEVTLASIPAEIPAELRPELIPLPEQPPAGGDAPQTGRVTHTLEMHEHDLWAFVPEDYNPNYEYSLLVWLHPSGSTMEAEMLKLWKPICRERGMILLAPQAAEGAKWTLNELGFIKDAVAWAADTYSVDPRRVIAHGYETGAVLAQHLVFKEREMFPAICLAGAPLAVGPQENRPDVPLQWNLVCGEKDPVFEKAEKSVEVLRKMRFPVSTIFVPRLGHEYPPENVVIEIGRWIDILDRI